MQRPDGPAGFQTGPTSETRRSRVVVETPAGRRTQQGANMSGLSQMQPGEKFYAALDTRVLAVLSRRVDGWCIYIGAVPGQSHAREWHAVAEGGAKLPRSVAEAV